jgi:hypothetical protein
MRDAVTRTAAALVEEAEEARRRGAGLPITLRLHGRPPAPAVDSSFSFPTSSSPPLAHGAVDKGWNPPRRLRLGA